MFAGKSVRDGTGGGWRGGGERGVREVEGVRPCDSQRGGEGMD